LPQVENPKNPKIGPPNCRAIRNNNCDLKNAESARLGCNKDRVQPREESEIKNRENAEQAFPE
jgi:hypothetical protein